MFCGITEIPLCFREGNGSMSQYSETSAFWLFNRVSNFCYLRYDVMIKDVQKVQSLLEKNWSEKLARFTINNATNEQTVSIINGLCSTMANEMMTSWKELDILLLTKYIDGNIKQEENGKILTTETGVVKYPSQPKYPDWFYRAIVEDHGDILQVK